MSSTSVTQKGQNELDVFFPTLLDGYASALAFIKNLHTPFDRRELVKFRFEGEMPDDIKASRETIVGNRKKYKGVIFSLVVKILVEAYIRSRLTSLLKQLKKRSLLIPTKKKELKILDQYIKQVEQYIDLLFGWEKFIIVFKSPVISIASGVLSPIVLSFLGLNINSWSDFVQSLFDLFQARGPDYIREIFTVIVVFVISIFYILAPIFAAGFRVKRAIFTGGVAEYRLFDWNPFDKRRDAVYWLSFPTTNIYHLEDKVFHILESSKTSEFPMDFIFDLAPYYIWILTILSTTGVFKNLFAGEQAPIKEIVYLILLWFVSITNLLGAVKNWRLRKQDKNL